MLEKILLFMLFFAFIFCQHQDTKEDAFFEDREVLKSDNRIAAYAIPNIVATPKGTMLCFATARIGDNHDWGNEQQVVMIRSTNNGQTWSEVEVIAAITDWSVRQTSAIVIPQTSKILIFGQKSPRFTADGERISETWNIAHPEERKALGAAQFYIESSDEGKTWSEMKEVDLPYWPHDPGISLKYGNHKGRLILPARTIKGTEFDWNNLYNGVLISDDHGQSWRAGGLTQSHVGEACVVELSDGRIYVNSRNHNDNFGIRVHAISSDGGETFSEVGNDPRLIEPTCDAGMIRLNEPGEGNLILFSNPAVKATKRWDGPKRRRMSVKASFDDCKTWPLEKLIFAGPAAYSGLAVGKDGMAFLVYERARLGSKDSRENIAIARFNLSWLKQKEIEPPQIKPQSHVFYKHVNVEIGQNSINKIRYTTDGTEPNEQSIIYTEPFELYKTTLIKAAAFSDGGAKSIVTTTPFIQSKYQAPKYHTNFSEKYPASGVFALVDGIHGSLNYHDGAWQGFEGTDMQVDIDLGKTVPVNQITAGFLQDQDAWIFFPEEVEVYFFKEGIEFIPLEKIVIDAKKPAKARQIKNITFNFDTVNTRFVRLWAKNIKTCPDWHTSARGKAWIFVDEIIIN